MGDGKAKRHALAWRITDRLNDVTRRFLGPAQLGDYEVPKKNDGSLPATPCAKCGRPLDQHELVRTEHQKMRLYCPDQASPDA
jgi:hypothetical protein